MLSLTERGGKRGSFHMPFPLATLALAIVLAQPAAAPEKEKTESEQDASRRAAERLEFMKKSVAAYSLTLAEMSAKDAAQTTARRSQSPRIEAMLEPEPLLRWSNIHGDDDGTLFLWTVAGRPVAVAQSFSVGKGKIWLHEFQSLSLDPFSLMLDGQVVWAPEKAGVAFKPLDDAPTPAKTAALRLSQMRSMASRFKASDDYGNKGNIWQLRRLTQPVYRYPKPDDRSSEAADSGRDSIDGAVFAFVVGTDPEMLLLFEARQEVSGPAWQYALAPMTAFELKASLSDKAVWSSPFRAPPFDRRGPFLVREVKP
jgi:hypothetical protein